MKRREFITLLGGMAVAWPNAIVAQQPDRMPKKMPVIGFLASAPQKTLQDAFNRGLREHGYVEGQNLIIEWRFWRGDREQLARFVADLVAKNVNLIVAATTIDALPSKRATNTIPLAIATGRWPVGSRPS